MRLAFESADLEFFFKYGVWTRASCELRVLVIGRGSHMLSLAFELNSVVSLFFQSTDTMFFFACSDVFLDSSGEEVPF